MDPNATLRLWVPGSREARTVLLAFMQARFFEHYGARIPDDSPLLVGVRDASGTLVAAFGIRDAGSGFFCERYLDGTLEAVMSRHLSNIVQRSEVVEITHLCASQAGCLRELVPLLTAMFVERGYRYLTCTATACLAAYLARRGLPSVTLGDASPLMLPEAERRCWGTYYAAKPLVLAGDLYHAANTLNLPPPARFGNV